MSDAIEGADVMLYGVCLRYKESANVSVPGAVTIDAAAESAVTHVGSCIFCHLSVSNGGELRSSAGAGHDPTDDARKLQTTRLA
eukprot:COSAG02_NODE_5468_length_4297_cov_3.717008_4_plen_84_part_00